MSSVSSPFGGAERQRGFWFNVNAELIIYGATEPDATVTIGDRKIKLRPDGTFSFRFALPDGEYPLPAAAHSADGEETREARLEFSRNTRLPRRSRRASAGQEPETAVGQRRRVALQGGQPALFSPGSMSPTTKAVLSVIAAGGLWLHHPESWPLLERFLFVPRRTSRCPGPALLVLKGVAVFWPVLLYGKARAHGRSFDQGLTDFPMQGHFALMLHAHLPVRPPSGTRKVSRGELAFRGHHRNLHPADPNAWKAGRTTA